ncbi:MAG: hypothetical protein DYG89_52045 [Caldilinea sp. CFX5]|nr:hypothetical protein [Caldilinea sp. CFX5]
MTTPPPCTSTKRCAPSWRQSEEAHTLLAQLGAPGSEGSNAYGKVFTRSDMAYVVAMAARLPQPPPGQAYHLWLVQGEQTELAGMMKINQDGFALVIYEADQNDQLPHNAKRIRRLTLLALLVLLLPALLSACQPIQAPDVAPDVDRYHCHRRHNRHLDQP